MQSLFFTLAVNQITVPDVMSVFAAMALSFIVITLFASYFRFMNIIKAAEQVQPAELGASADEVLRVQLACALASGARSGNGFSLAFLRLKDPSFEVKLNEPFVDAIKAEIRRDDVTLVYDEQTVVLILESEPDDAVAIFTRVATVVAEQVAEVAFEQINVGIASYPLHGLTGKELVKNALATLEKTTPEEPVMLSEIIEEYDEDEDEEAVATETIEAEQEAAPKKTKKSRSSVVDELTGVLKASSISLYMQRAMYEYRRKKLPVALFCIGINNLEHIARFFGEEALDDVLVEVSSILEKNIRSTDLVGRHEQYAFLILAQLAIDEAEPVGKRLSTLIQQGYTQSGNKKIKTTITLGVANYPEHGRNLHLLYEAGQKVLDYNRLNDIRAYAVYDPEVHDKMPSKPMKSIKSMSA